MLNLLHYATQNDYIKRGWCSVIDRYPFQGVFMSVHYSWDRLRIHHYPDMDETVTEDE